MSFFYLEITSTILWPLFYFLFSFILLLCWFQTIFHSYLNWKHFSERVYCDEFSVLCSFIRSESFVSEHYVCAFVKSREYYDYFFKVSTYIKLQILQHLLIILFFTSVFILIFQFAIISMNKVLRFVSDLLINQTMFLINLYENVKIFSLFMISNFF